MGTSKDIQKFNYADYLRMKDGFRWELINGVRRPVTAYTDERKHIVQMLLDQFYEYSVSRNLLLLTGDWDVLPLGQSWFSNEETTTVVHPDLCLCNDSGRVEDGKCYRGAPPLVVEVLSHGDQNALKEKIALYQEAGVRELWIVYPYGQQVDVLLASAPTTPFRTTGPFYHAGTYGSASRVKVAVLEKCYIDLSRVFGMAPDEGKPVSKLNLLSDEKQEKEQSIYHRVKESDGDVD